MILPQALTEWTNETAAELVSQGVFESDEFDIKEMLPDPRNYVEKMKLRATCSAFANSGGGF